MAVQVNIDDNKIDNFSVGTQTKINVSQSKPLDELSVSELFSKQFV